MATGSPIKKLGDLFKLTEVQLWDYDNLYGSSLSCGTHIYFDGEADSSSTNTETQQIITEEEEVCYNNEEDLELARHMDALGLPLSFSSSKNNNRVNGEKKMDAKSKSKSEPCTILETKNEETSEIACDGISKQVECGDWRIQWDDFYKRYYFYNVQSEESTWQPPIGLENFDFSQPDCFDQQTGEQDQSIVENYEVQLIGTEDDAGMVTLLYKESAIENSKESLGPEIDEVYDEIMQKEQENDNNNWTKRKKKKRVRRNKSRQKLERETSNSGVWSGDISKYWSQRYKLFSKFDSGIEMDEEGWFSVTPEAIARHHGFRCGSGVVVDCFTGVAGNAIQFALTNKHVIAIDIDPQKIEYARNNAAIYAVDGKIDFIVGDSIQIAQHFKGDTAFMSPPWGGPDYVKSEIYDIQTMLKPRDGYFLFKLGTKIASRVVMFLPRNVDLNQLAELALSVDPPWKLEVEKNVLNGKFKAITAYFEKQ
ncbi:hypothetical protein LUZ60_006586 [Juncus effusus]|nr:hypothetical protein LUZ60_006586 [Juncus effusus]